MPIDLLITGGTLDKDYHPLTGELVFGESHIAEMLQQANETLKPRLQVILQKDSLEMTDEDRKLIAQHCAQSSHQLVITHGTDTMVETALTLQQDPRLTNKTIVLTGAMRPFKLGHSDALFNLGCALTACQLLPSGVYINMNGQSFRADQVTKNRSLGIFEAKETD